MGEIALTIRVPREVLLQALSERVPEVLARGGRRVSMGRLSYSVRRGPFELGLRRNALVVEVPIRVNAGVCVPLGALCPSLGGCSPALTTTVEVPLALNRRYELGPSRVRTDVERGCTIAGHDATGLVKRNASRQSAELKRRLDELLPSIEPEMSALWRGLGRPLPRPDGGCLAAEPMAVVQYPATLTASHLALHLGVVATLEEQQPCRAVPPEPASPLPTAAARPATEPRTGIAVARRLEWGFVAAQLERALATGEPPPFSGGPVTAVEASGVLLPAAAGRPSTAQIALRIQTAELHCEPAWLVATPRAEADGSVLLVPASAGDAMAGPLARKVAAWLAQHGRLRLDDPPEHDIGEALRHLAGEAASHRGAAVQVSPYELVTVDRSLAAGRDFLWESRRDSGTITITLSPPGEPERPRTANGDPRPVDDGPQHR